MAGRELAIGLGTLHALADGEDPAPWIRAGATADAVDAIALVAAADDLGAGLTIAGTTIAATAAVVGFRLAEQTAH